MVAKTQGQKQAKEFPKEQRSEITRNLLSKDMKIVKMMVCLLTGHRRLKGHVHNIGLAEDAICK